ncbi:hypothetical protein [Microbacterium murale]|uniref:Glycosyltransferase RgtA/B/C/D-like domain-containing protein n=1 Tax=Microbacterium murale TaxID=1081040 RepID=A0ABU0PCK5_9MICO|nr:hypothetical protein [Microbacterium murale]MDQ0645058.1 hypothetical protein [Microbacterium murale]
MTRSAGVFLRWTIAGLIALVFLVFMSPTTSFFNTVYGGDSAIFRVIGSAMHRGQELYVDVWDHKGPTLFFVEWLGQVVHEGRLGIFALQVVSLTVSLALIMSIARRFTSVLGTAGILALVLAVLSYTFEGGNLSEEFSLPFIIFVLYGAVRVLADDEKPGSAREMILLAGMGCAFAFTFFIRANNAMPIAGIFAGLLIQLILRRAPVVKRFAIAVVGFILMTGAIVGWFALRGTLDDMLNATFWFNLRYLDDASSRSKALAYVLTVVLTVAMAGAGVIGQLLRFGARRSIWVLGVMLGVTSVYAVLSPTTSYAHYLTLIIPLVVLGGVMLMHALGPRSRNIIAVIMIAASSATIMHQVPSAIRYYGAVRDVEASYQGQLDDVLSDVPESRRAEVFPWSLPATYYLMTDTLPTYKYFITQPWWGTIDSRVVTDTVAHIEQSRPEWVLIPATGAGDPALQGLLDSEYTSVRVTDRFELFALER